MQRIKNFVSDQFPNVVFGPFPKGTVLRRLAFSAQMAVADVGLLTLDTVRFRPDCVRLIGNADDTSPVPVGGLELVGPASGLAAVQASLTVAGQLSLVGGVSTVGYVRWQMEFPLDVVITDLPYLRLMSSQVGPGDAPIAGCWALEATPPDGFGWTN